MHTATATLESTSPYSQSRPYEVPKKSKELAGDYERRTWQHRLHVKGGITGDTVPSDGEIIIPAMAFKNALSEAAKFVSMQIPGKGKSTYTKHFEAGVQCLDNVPLGITVADVRADDVFVPSDGVRGSGKRVWKTFPVIDQWSATVDFVILDDTITRDVFLAHLQQAGQLIGIGRWRPRNNGMYGRFIVKDLQWSEYSV